jgi:hypothetical protein
VESTVLYRGAGQRESISRIISSAHRTASAIAVMVAGMRFPPSYPDNFRAANIAGAMSNTHLRPSPTNSSI